MKRRLMISAVALMLLVSLLAAPMSASAATKVKILKVTEAGARVRAGAGDYEVLTSLKKGAKVFYLGKTKKAFAYVRTETGTVGYMYTGYLKSYGTCYREQIYRSKSSKVPVYKKASTGSKKVTKLSKNQHVIVYQVKGSWAYIKTLGGTGGYVKKSKLKKV